MTNTAKSIALLGILGALLVGLGWGMGGPWIFVAGALALALNLGAWFWSDRIVLRVHRAQEIPREENPRLHAMVEDLARRAGLPMPRLYRIPDPTPNAFATGRDPQHGVVALTDGIMELLPERELRGVVAHELAHIKNRDVLIATIGAILAGAVGHVANFIQFSVLFGGGDDEDAPSPLAAIALAVVAPLAAALVNFAVSRSREFEADRTGALISGDPEALARALARLERGVAMAPEATVATPATASLFIVNPLAGTGERLAELMSTHPRTEERVARLLAMAGRRAA